MSQNNSLRLIYNKFLYNASYFCYNALTFVVLRSIDYCIFCCSSKHCFLFCKSICNAKQIVSPNKIDSYMLENPLT